MKAAAAAVPASRRTYISLRAWAAVRRARPGAIETREQLAHVLAQVPWAGRPPCPDRTSRFRGCLLGGAVGDALGAPVEFMDLAEIRARFGISTVAIAVID